jgi:hypothetical protein
MSSKGGDGGGAEAKALPTRNLFHPQAGAYPKPFTKHRGQETFLSPGHPLFDELMATSYSGFQKKRATNLMPEYTAALGQLEAAGAFQYDVTQPMGIETPCARTKVTRTLVGQPGITYKYLGMIQPLVELYGGCMVVLKVS